MKYTEKDLSRVRRRLLLDHPFWGVLAMRLELRFNDKIPTACVDGVSIEWNPTFWGSLTDAERMGVMAHEVSHPALGHLFRREGRDPKRWNIAADFAENPLLIESGLTLPQGALFDPRFKGMLAEQIYTKIQAQEEKGQGNPQLGNGSSSGDTCDTGKSYPGLGSTGEFVDPPPSTGETPADEPRVMNEADWKQAVAEAEAVARAAGQLPGNLAEHIKLSRQPQIDWRGQLQQFITNTIVSRQSWCTPNKRYIAIGTYLPGPLKENVGKIVFAIDTSASVTKRMLEQFGAEANGILHTVHPETLYVLHADTRVNKVDEYTPHDNGVTLNATGRGGTTFGPTFKWIKDNNIDPLCIVYLTDLDNSDKGFTSDVSCPVLWCTPNHVNRKPPFGEVLRIPGI